MAAESCMTEETVAFASALESACFSLERCFRCLLLLRFPPSPLALAPSLSASLNPEALVETFPSALCVLSLLLSARLLDLSICSLLLQEKLL